MLFGECPTGTRFEVQLKFICPIVIQESNVGYQPPRIELIRMRELSLIMLGKTAF